MSSEIDHPHQRTVAELLAEHGDAGASGRRRRRRAAESDTFEPAADDAFVYGGAAPEIARWSADRSVLRDPVPPDDGTATWDPIGASRAVNGSTPRDPRDVDAGGRGAGSGPLPSDHAATSGYASSGYANNGYTTGSRPDDGAPSGGSPVGGPDGQGLSRGDVRRDDAQRSNRGGPDGYGPGPTLGTARTAAGSASDDDGSNGWSFDGRSHGDGAGGPHPGRGPANGWSGGSDVDPSSWSSGGGRQGSGPNGSGPDTVGPDTFSRDTFGRDTFGRDTFGRDGSGQDTFGRYGSGPDGSRPDRFGPDRSGSDGFVPDRSGSDRSGSDRFGSDGFGSDGVGPDRFVSDAPVGNGWAHGTLPPGGTGAVDPNGAGARSDVPLRNGSANRPPAGNPVDPNAGNGFSARGGVPPRTADGGTAFTAMLADLEPDRPQGTARLAIPLRDAPRGPRAGDAQPLARRVPDNLTQQFSPVRGDSTAIIDPGPARPLPPAPGVGDGRAHGAPTRSSGPRAPEDDQPAGLGRAWSGGDQADPRNVADRRPAGVADLDLDEPPAAPVRSRRKAPSSSGQAWAGVLAQWILGAIGGAALWVGFRFLWQELTVVAIAAAVIVTVGLVLVVRHLLRNDDRRTTVFAVLIGLLLTVSPALLVLLHR